MYEYLTKLLEFYSHVKPELDGTTPFSIYEGSSKYILGFKLFSVMFLGCWYLHITSHVQMTTLTVFVLENIEHFFIQGKEFWYS